MPKSEFRVALNPHHPEANSWYSPTAKVNLSLSPRREPKSTEEDPVWIKDTGPVSRDLSGLEDIDDIKRGIQSGLLIVAVGDMPEGVNVIDIPHSASPRPRWNPLLIQQRDDAVNNHRAAVTKAKSAAAKSKAIS